MSDAPSASAANDYVNRYDVNFGWRTNDADNTLGPFAVANSMIFAGVPWTGVIRTSDMQLVYDEPDDRYLDIMSIAMELAREE